MHTTIIFVHLYVCVLLVLGIMQCLESKCQTNFFPIKKIIMLGACAPRAKHAFHALAPAPCSSYSTYHASHCRRAQHLRPPQFVICIQQFYQRQARLIMCVAHVTLHSMLNLIPLCYVARGNYYFLLSSQ